MKKVNGIFEMHVTKDGKESVYTIDLKKVCGLPNPMRTDLSSPGTSWSIRAYVSPPRLFTHRLERSSRVRPSPRRMVRPLWLRIARLFIDWCVSPFSHHHPQGRDFPEPRRRQGQRTKGVFSLVFLLQSHSLSLRLNASSSRLSCPASSRSAKNSPGSFPCHPSGFPDHSSSHAGQRQHYARDQARHCPQVGTSPVQGLNIHFPKQAALCSAIMSCCITCPFTRSPCSLRVIRSASNCVPRDDSEPETKNSAQGGSSTRNKHDLE